MNQRLTLLLLLMSVLAQFALGQTSEPPSFSHPSTSLLLNFSYTNTAFTQNGSAGISISRFLPGNVEAGINANIFGIENSNYSYDASTKSPKEQNSVTTMISWELTLNYHLTFLSMAEGHLVPYVGAESGGTYVKSDFGSSSSEQVSWLYGGAAGMVMYLSSSWAIDGSYRLTYADRPTPYGNTALIDEASFNLGIRTFF
ncbi:MAG: outer membrane beta-barrel protein [Bacteroidota bacterium]